MSLSKRIIKKYGSIKEFCKREGLNYDGFRVALTTRYFGKKYKDAIVRAGIVESEREFERVLFEDTQARNLAKEA